MSMERKNEGRPKLGFQYCIEVAGNLKDRKETLIKLLSEYLKQPSSIESEVRHYRDLLEAYEYTDVDGVLSKLDYIVEQNNRLKSGIEYKQGFSPLRFKLQDILDFIAYTFGATERLHSESKMQNSMVNPEPKDTEAKDLEIQNILESFGHIMQEFEPKTGLLNTILDYASRDHTNTLLAISNASEDLRKRVLLDDFFKILKIIKILNDNQLKFKHSEGLMETVDLIWATEACNNIINEYETIPTSSIPSLRAEFNGLMNSFAHKLAHGLNDSFDAGKIHPVTDDALSILFVYGDKPIIQSILKHAILSVMKGPIKENNVPVNLVEKILALNNAYRVIDNKLLNDTIDLVVIESFEKYLSSNSADRINILIMLRSLSENFVAKVRPAVLKNLQWSPDNTVNNILLRDGSTLLLTAIQAKDLTMTKLLLQDLKADPDQPSRSGMTPLFLFALTTLKSDDKFAPVIIDMLLKHPNINLESEYKNDNILQAAVKNNNLVFLNLLAKTMKNNYDAYALLDNGEGNDTDALSIVLHDPRTYKEILPVVLQMHEERNKILAKKMGSFEPSIKPENILVEMLKQYRKQFWDDPEKKRTPEVVVRAIKLLEDGGSFTEAYSLLEKPAQISTDKPTHDKWTLKEIISLFENIYPEKTKSLSSNESLEKKKQPSAQREIGLFSGSVNDAQRDAKKEYTDDGFDFGDKVSNKKSKEPKKADDEWDEQAESDWGDQPVGESADNDALWGDDHASAEENSEEAEAEEDTAKRNSPKRKS